ncbi:MAG: ABC transporter family substrate-binding protein, partial [Mycobacteriaceae bacterium]|nr:ABC transporter family substrate-binding protein [Mycobacteriaceae bacterium]
GNEADTASMLRPTMPRAFVIAPDGSMKVDTDYFTSVELTSTEPQVVTYTINPKATWSDGTPITWEDIAAQINATSGKDKAFAIASPNGSDRVGSVTRGVDDRQAIVTFAQHYPEWRGMFAGNTMLLPKSMTADPDVFNKGQLDGPGPSAGPFIVNGAPGSILADKALRQAVAKGIDRQAIVNVSQRGLVDNPTPLGNHVFVAGQEGYQDNSAVVAFDPEKAKAELDALGWKLNGQFREKDGRQLVIRNVLYDSQSGRQVGQVAQNSLAQIGVKMELDVKAADGFFSRYVTVGDFDVTQFSWVGDAFSLCCLNQIFTTGAESNFGKISSPEIDAKVEEVLDELDPVKARALANEVDTMLWDEVFSLALFQSPGNVAVRSTLANFGPTGLGDLDYSTIGFTK